MDTAAWMQLAVYVVTLIWGAAVVKTELRYLRGDLQEFKQSVSRASEVVAETLNDHGERISRIEGRLQ